MRTRINLASQPYENLQRFWLLWGTALLVSLLVTGALVYTAAHAWRDAHRTARLVSQEKDRLAQLDKLEKQDRDLLDSGPNREVHLKSEFLNSLILRKRFSWTQIFSDLEKIMPERLHVISISPELTADGQIRVRLQIAGDSRQKAIALVSNMEGSRSFHQARVLSESTVDTKDMRTAGDIVQFQLSVIYEPAAETAAAAPRSGQ